MALADLVVFNEYLQTTTTQIVAQQVDLFNAASDGCFVLSAADHAGDFSSRSMFQRFGQTVRRRNAYGDGNIPAISLTMTQDNMVKIAGGTPEFMLPPSQFEWINANQATAAAAMAQQLAEAMVLDMFNTAVTIFLASHLQVTGLIADRTAIGDGSLDLKAFNAGQAKYGDRFGAIRSWVMHSGAMFKFWDKLMDNSTQLFEFGTLAIMRDPFGRPFIVSDAPALRKPGAQPSDPVTYYTIGTVPGAVRIDQNDDFTDNWDKKNGKENIQVSYQAEWSYNAGVKGFAWDVTNGGKSPTNEALAMASNWDRVPGYNDRDLGGVILKSQVTQ